MGSCLNGSPIKKEEINTQQDFDQPPHNDIIDLSALTSDCPEFTLAGMNVDAKVVRVKDGDTICCCLALPGMLPRQWTVRMLGYDSCEIHTRNLKEKLHGFATTLMLEEKILNKVLRVEFSNADKYGRWLATIYQDGVNINDWVIDNSPSVPYTGGKKNKDFDYECSSPEYLKHMPHAQIILDSKRKPRKLKSG
jgi:endonuclease YncB( thermonuclease family)